MGLLCVVCTGKLEVERLETNVLRMKMPGEQGFSGNAVHEFVRGIK